ncbi:serine/threonine-protein kinase drkA [Phytophthora cinnamomi]|uniref:serine/threonine-protein kinase drkA n=1 Tax=Phytophthora cinnamomi TaxID=4785 RepID=UPI00355950FF|nr:serine/threonine-protein kinase drkA [Phytophthora cinnamomi]
MDSVAPIIKLPEHYSVDNERLGLALAHVSAQANRLAEVHAVLTDRQAEQDARHKQFVEERVAQARLEAEARTQALVRAINQAYGDPTALERRVDDRIQCVLTTLQDASLSQAREMAEAQLAEQKAARRAIEERINAALVDVQERAAVRAEQTAQSLVANLNDEMLRLQQAAGSERDLLRADVELLARRTAQGVELAEERARAIAGSEVDNQLSRALTSLEDRVVRRVETHLLGLVKSLMEENR